MEHTPAAHIYQTTDYGRFHLINGNRELNSSKINNIRGDIVGGFNMLRECPVIVVEKDDRLHVVDGQHRFWVSKMLKLPVFYVLAKNVPLSRIALMNSRTEKWRNSDYLHCHCAQDNEHYRTLQAFMDKYALPSSTALPLLYYGRCGDGNRRHGLMKDMKLGVYEVKELEKATRVMDAARRFSSFAAHKTRYFIGAIAQLMDEGTNMDDLIASHEANPELHRAHTVVEYIDQLSMILNTH